MHSYGPLIRAALMAVAILCAAGGCGRTRELQNEVNRLKAENQALQRELEKQIERVDALIASYDRMEPKLDEIENEIDTTRDSLSKLKALTSGDTMDERTRMELKALIREVVEETEEAERREQAQWGPDLFERHLDELASSARLTPEQKEKIEMYIRQEREQTRAAYISFAAGLSTAEDIRRAKDEARLEKEKKIKQLLAPDQFEKYKEWARERDLFRAGVNRRQQAPDADQDDL